MDDSSQARGGCEHVNSTVGGFGAPGLGEEGARYTLTEPPALTRLRRQYPEIDRYFAQLRVDSFKGAPHEEEVLVYRSRRTGRLMFNRDVMIPDPNNANLLTWANPEKRRFPLYRGYDLILTAHTHWRPSYIPGHIGCWFRDCSIRGPSKKYDMPTANQYPKAFHLVLGWAIYELRPEIYYYGEMAGIDD